MIYQLDTDHVSVLQRGGASSGMLQARLSRLAPDDYGTAVVTYEEQCRGWTALIARARTGAERLEAYALLKENLRFFSGIAVWDYSSAAEAQFGAWSQTKVRVGTKDLRIAAIALANNATLLSRNLRDFTRVPGLRVEDRTAQPPPPRPSLAKKPSASALQRDTVRPETADRLSAVPIRCLIAHS